MKKTNNDNRHGINKLNHVTIDSDIDNVLISETVTSAHTVIHIVDDLNLNGGTMTILSNCTLSFEGGSISNGTIIGDGTRLNASIYSIFGPNVIIQGTWLMDEVYPQWFGAVGDGMADDTSAFLCLATLCSNVAGLKVRIPLGHYIIKQGLVFGNDVTIRGEGPGTILDWAQMTVHHPFNCMLFTKEVLERDNNNKVVGIVFDKKGTLASNATKGDRSIIVSNVAAIKYDDLLLLQDKRDYSYSQERDYYKQGEIHRVKTSDTDNNHVELDGSLYGTYDTAAYGDVYKLKPIYVNLSHLSTIFSDDSVNNASRTGIMIVSGCGCVVSHIHASGSSKSHISLSNCYQCSISHITVNYCSVANGFNYGIAIGQSQDISISSCYLRTTRHGLTVGGGGPFGICIVNRNINIVDSTISTYPFDRDGTRDVMAGMNTHGNSEYVTVENCVLDGGVGISGDFLTVRNCMISNEQNECSLIGIGNSHCNSIEIRNNSIQVLRPIAEQYVGSYRYIHLNITEVDDNNDGAVVFVENRITFGQDLRNSDETIAMIKGISDSANEVNNTNTINAMGTRDIDLPEPKLRVRFVRNSFKSNSLSSICNKRIRIAGYLREVLFEDNDMDCSIDAYTNLHKVEEFKAVGNRWTNTYNALSLSSDQSGIIFDSVVINENMVSNTIGYAFLCYFAENIQIVGNIISQDVVTNDNKNWLFLMRCNHVLRKDNVETSHKLGVYFKDCVEVTDPFAAPKYLNSFQGNVFSYMNVSEDVHTYEMTDGQTWTDNQVPSLAASSFMDHFKSSSYKRINHGESSNVPFATPSNNATMMVIKSPGAFDLRALVLRCSSVSGGLLTMKLVVYSENQWQYPPTVPSDEEPISGDSNIGVNPDELISNEWQLPSVSRLERVVTTDMNHAAIEIDNIFTVYSTDYIVLVFSGTHNFKIYNICCYSHYLRSMSDELLITNGLPYFINASSKAVKYPTTIYADSYQLNDVQQSGTTTQRPSSANLEIGFQYFDTTMGKPVYWNGTSWVDANGIIC